MALLDTDRMALQLTQLERRPARDGKDSIFHPRGGHEDVVNRGSFAGVWPSGMGDYISDDDEGYRPPRPLSGADAWMGG